MVDLSPGGAAADFPIEAVLEKPLMAHLATASPEGPRDSPVWFLWEDGAIHLVGSTRDSFPRRLRAEPRCAVGVVDFDLAGGVLRHVGIRGAAAVGPVDPARLERLVGRYLGPDRAAWNRWFADTIVAPLDLMVRVRPDSVVAKDVSYFRTGPALAGGLSGRRG